ncbi:hypothetical protein [Lujinxingia sediminis]|nr:hypothetical protein [Lujinxingia sediminis]
MTRRFTRGHDATRAIPQMMISAVLQTLVRDQAMLAAQHELTSEES